MGEVHCAVGSYINSMAELQTTMDNCQNTILAAVRRLVEYQSSCLPDGDSLHTHNGPWYAPDDPTLPQPWKGLVDGSSGSIYFWNTETNITQYEKPNPVFFLPTDHYSCVSAPPVPNTNYHHNSSLTHPIIPYPSQNGLPFTTSVYPSGSDYGYLSSPYPWDQPFPCDPYSTSPHNSFYSPITCPHTEPKEPIIPPYQLPYVADLIPPFALASTAGGTSCTEKDDVPPQKMKKSLCCNLKLRSHVMMKRKPRSQFPRRRRAQNNGGSEGDLCKASSRMAANWNSIVLSDKSVDSLSQLTILDLVVKKGSISVSSKNAPLFFPGDKKKPFLSVEAVYGQMLGPDEFCKTGRANDLLRLADFQRIKDNSGGPLVDGELKSIDMDLVRFFFNLSLEKPIMNSSHIHADDEQNAIVNHFCSLVVVVDHFSLVTNFLSDLNLILLSMSFVESPVTLEVSLPKSYQHGIEHETVAFDKFLVCSSIFMALIEIVTLAHFCDTLPNWKARAKNVLASSKEGFEYDMHLENLIESLTRNSQRFFIKMDGRRIESNCSVSYHWLPSSLNWDKEFLSDAFSGHEFSVSFVTLKFLPSEFCKSGSKFLKKEMVEASLENTGLKVMIGTHWKVMNSVLHLVGTLVIVFVGHTISIALVDDQNLGGALIVLELQLGLLIVVVLLFAAVNQLRVIGITSDGLVIASIADSCNKKLLVCSLITTAASKKIWGQFISLENHNLDVQLNFLVQCIFRIECQHMDISCILHSCGKRLNQSHFLVQLQKNSGIIFFAILEQLKQTYGVMCFVSPIEGYLVNYLLSGEANMSEHWSNKSSKFGECRVDELLQCKDKMKISPKLDDTSWKLVVIQSVKAVLKENANFYHYVKWAISLVILHLGCQSFFFFYDGIGHFQTDTENLTIINGGAKDGNMLSCKVATEVSIGNVLGPPGIYVAWKKTTFLHVFYITLLHSILDVDLVDILNTLASANAIALQNTTWNVILIFSAIHSQAFSMSLFEMAPKQFYTATVAAKVRQYAITMLNMTSAIFSLAEIGLGLHYPSLDEADNCLKINSMVVLFRYHSGTHLTMVNSTVTLALMLDFLALTPYYTAPGMINLFETTLTHSRGYWLNWEVMPCAPWDFILMLITSLIVGQRVVQVLYWQLYADGAGQRHSLILGPPLYKRANFSRSNTFAMHLLAFVVIFGGIDAANSIGILQTCQEEYRVQSYRKEVNGHTLLIMNPSDVVLKKSMLTLSTFNSCGYWNAKKAAKANAQMQEEGIQSTVNLCTEDLSNVAGQTKAIWLQLKDIGFNSLPSTILRHEDTPFFKGGGMIGSLGYGPTLIKWAACLIGSITVIGIKA